MSNKIINEILIEYEKKRARAEDEAYRRQCEIYEKIPRIKAIDTELSSMGVEVARAILNKRENIDDIIENLKQRSIDLKMEKGELLAQYNYPFDYTQIKYECPNCKDTGYIGNEKCSCLRQRIIDRYYNQSNLKNILPKENFETFVFDYYSTSRYEDEPLSPRKNMERIFAAAVNFSKDFDNTNENLFFYGNSGLGKTFLSHCIAKDLLDRGKLVIYQTAPDLIENLKKASFKNDESSDFIAEDILECDLLIIDDLGTEYFKTDFTQMELYNIINKRLLNNKKMIISTNLHLQEILNTYAERLTSRIFGSFTMYKFYGDDIRLKIGDKMRKRSKK